MKHFVFDVGQHAAKCRQDSISPRNIPAPGEHAETFNQVQTHVHDLVSNIHIQPPLAEENPGFMPLDIVYTTRHHRLTLPCRNKNHFPPDQVLCLHQEIADGRPRLLKERHTQPGINSRVRLPRDVVPRHRHTEQCRQN